MLLLYYSGPSTEDSSEVPFHSRKKKSQIEKPASEIAEGIEPHDFFKMLHSKCIWQPLYWWFVGLGDDAMADDAASTVLLVHSGPKTPKKVPEVHSEGILIKKVVLFLTKLCKYLLMDGISKPNSLSLYLGQKITQIVLVVKTKSIVYSLYIHKSFPNPTER